jgi:LysR family nitrogen assimilation transcriptional regulator
MSVDFTKLKSFVKIVDAGSVSRAASILRTAQPALSQQIAALESHFKHKLLTRSNTGITPTEAGLVLYRHAQLLLKQIEQAKIDIDNSSKSLAGRVSIGLATYSTSSALSLPILKEMKSLHPQIIVHINDSFGHVLSELIMTGRMDMAIIYGSEPIKGVTLRPLFREELFLVSPPGTAFDKPSTEALPLSALADVQLLLPSKGHFLRRLIDESLARARVAPHVVGFVARCGRHGWARFHDTSCFRCSRRFEFCRGGYQAPGAPGDRGNGLALHLGSPSVVGTRSGGPIGASRRGREAHAQASARNSVGAISKVYSGRPHLCWLAPAASRSLQS